MARLLDTQKYLDTVCDLLRQGEHSVAVPVAGSSMTPFLINGDTVYLDLPEELVGTFQNVKIIDSNNWSLTGELARSLY